MSSVQQLCDGALAAMGRSDEGALHLCCGGLMSRCVCLAFDDLEAVCALAMAPPPPRRSAGPSARV